MAETCAVTECTSHARARGWCMYHYNCWRNHGDPEGPEYTQAERKLLTEALQELFPDGLTTPAERAAHGERGYVYKDRACPTCGGPVPLPRWRKPRIYCSDRCQRQAYNFRARCCDCGEPCRRLRCERCANRRNAAARKKWHREAVLAVLVEWIEVHGHPPTYAEWVATHMNPGGNIVQREFGSWSAGVAAAQAARVREKLPDRELIAA